MADTGITDPRIELFAELVDRVRNNSHLAEAETVSVDTGIYVDDDHLAREKATIFSDVPLIIGHASMIPEPGDHFTHDHLDKPMLVVRGKDGQVRVFLNACRHRGVRLANNTDVERRKQFTCPYHHWSYDLDGSLKSVPLEESLPGLDKGCRGLIGLPAEVRHGFIWVVPNPDGKLDLDDWLGDMNRDFEKFDVAGQFYFAHSTKRKKTNWKLIVDAFLDGYHVARLHRKSIGPMFMDSISVANQAGPHIRSMVARTEFPEALEMSRGQWSFSDHVTMAYQIFPNTTLVFHPDYLSILTVYPVASDETIVQHICLIPEPIKDEKEQAHWDRAFDIIENRVFEAEDFFVCEQAQIGLNAGVQPDFLLGGYEVGIAMYHRELAARLV